MELFYGPTSLTAKMRRKPERSPRTPGQAKSNTAKNSSRSFCTGVPERRTRRWHPREESADMVLL